MCDLVMAVRTITVVTQGSRAHRRIKAGTVLCADDPIVRGREKLFQPVKVEHHCKAAKSKKDAKEDPVVVEQATAAPGERRTVRLPDGPQRPPTSGPGSGVDAWRSYVAETTGTSDEDLAGLSRDDLITLAV